MSNERLNKRRRIGYYSVNGDGHIEGSIAIESYGDNGRREIVDRFRAESENAALKQFTLRGIRHIKFMDDGLPSNTDGCGND